MHTLIICEKNNAAYRIANILSNNSANKTAVNKVPIYDYSRDGEHYTVIGLRGHILSLDYPAEFNVWDRVKPRDLIAIDPYKRIDAYQIVSVLKRLAKDVDQVIIATDYDREGELIGTEALDIILESKAGLPSKRARFSALTREEIETAFANTVEVDFNLSDSAETRQRIDLVWGATLTRFLSLTSNQTGKDFLSVGRVQSPTLAIIVDREKEILAFKPEPFWEIIATSRKKADERTFWTMHVIGRFTKEEDAKAVFEKVKDAKVAIVKEYKKEERRDLPPAPFSTTTFLAAASAMGYSAPKAMDIAETLYTQGYISYPRTDNTVYPKSLSLRSILLTLAKGDFKPEVERILSQDKIYPSRGKSETKDHPPIHPTDVAPKNKIGHQEWQIYELVVRRFLATVAPAGIYDDSEVILDIKGEDFKGDGKHYKSLGWRDFYPYFKLQEEYLPDLTIGEKVDVIDIEDRRSMTKPPNRFSQGALIQKMEDLGLGTKATRHEIIQKLYSRGYVEGKSPIPTEIGFAVVDALERHAETITRPEMTATLESEMDRIADGLKDKGEVLSESREMLDKVFAVLEVHAQQIGQAIRDALAEQNVIGACKVCIKEGRAGNLTIKRSRRGKRFVGCDQYPACTNSYPLPQRGKVVIGDEECATCGAPRVKIISKGRRPWDICINMQCSAKSGSGKTKTAPATATTPASSAPSGHRAEVKGKPPAKGSKARSRPSKAKPMTTTARKTDTKKSGQSPRKPSKAGSKADDKGGDRHGGKDTADDNGA